MSAGSLEEAEEKAQLIGGTVYTLDSQASESIVSDSYKNIYDGLIFRVDSSYENWEDSGSSGIDNFTSGIASMVLNTEDVSFGKWRYTNDQSGADDRFGFLVDVTEAAVAFNAESNQVETTLSVQDLPDLPRRVSDVRAWSNGIEDTPYELDVAGLIQGYIDPSNPSDPEALVVLDVSSRHTKSVPGVLVRDLRQGLPLGGLVPPCRLPHRLQ